MEDHTVRNELKVGSVKAPLFLRASRILGLVLIASLIGTSLLTWVPGLPGHPALPGPLMLTSPENATIKIDNGGTTERMDPGANLTSTNETLDESKQTLNGQSGQSDHANGNGGGLRGGESKQHHSFLSLTFHYSTINVLIYYVLLVIGLLFPAFFWEKTNGKLFDLILRKLTLTMMIRNSAIRREEQEEWCFWLFNKRGNGTYWKSFKWALFLEILHFPILIFGFTYGFKYILDLAHVCPPNGTRFFTCSTFTEAMSEVSLVFLVSSISVLLTFKVVAIPFRVALLVSPKVRGQCLVLLQARPPQTLSHLSMSFAHMGDYGDFYLVNQLVRILKPEVFGEIFPIFYQAFEIHEREYRWDLDVEENDD